MKVKNILKTTLLILVAALFFSGCMDFGKDSNLNDKRLVSALGFDSKGNKLSVILETIEAEGDGKVGSRLLKGEGENIASIITEIEAQSPRTLGFTHTKTVVLGSGLSPSKTAEIFDYLKNKTELPLSVKLVCAENAEGLLQVSDEEGEASGYEISNIVEKTAEKLGVAAHTTLYEIETARLQPINIYALPEMKIKNEGLFLDGSRVFLKDEYFNSLSYEQSVVYALLRNVYDGGEIYTDDDVFKITSAKTDITAALFEERLQIEIKLKTEPQNEELLEMVSSVVNNLKTDIFGFGEIIENEYPEVWSKIKKSYREYYKKADIKVVMS